VTIIRDKNAMDSSKNVDSAIVKKMLEEALIKVTGQKNPKDAWLSLVKPTDMIGLVPTDHLNPTHEEVVEAVKSSLVDAGIPRKRITLAQGGPDEPKECTALIALPALKAHWLTGIGTVLKDYIMFSGRSSFRYDGTKTRWIVNIKIRPHAR